MPSRIVESSVVSGSRFLRGVVCVSALMAVAGCATRQKPSVPTLESQVCDPSPQRAYIIRPGDLISVKFYHNPELNEEVVIRPDGMISLQLVGDVQAAGLSPAGLASDLTEKYVGELASPKVSVIVRQFGGERVYVSGEVTKQGVVPLTSGLTLYQAIEEAGGLLDTAHRKQVVLIRRGRDGHPTGTTIDIRPVESGTHPEDDVPLRAYDIVFVPKSKIGDLDVFVDQYVRRLLPPIPFAITPF
jgi:polysaccharide biosynthesis/export protein